MQCVKLAPVFEAEKILKVFADERLNLDNLKAVLRYDNTTGDFDDVFDILPELKIEPFRRLETSLNGALFHNFCTAFNNIFEACLPFTPLYKLKSELACQIIVRSIVRSKVTRDAIQHYFERSEYEGYAGRVSRYWDAFVEINIDEQNDRLKNDNEYWKNSLMNEEWFQVALNAYNANPDQLIYPEDDCNPFINDADIPEKPERMPFFGFKE